MTLKVGGTRNVNCYRLEPRQGDYVIGVAANTEDHGIVFTHVTCTCINPHVECDGSSQVTLFALDRDQLDVFKSMIEAAELDDMTIPYTPERPLVDNDRPGLPISWCPLDHGCDGEGDADGDL